MAGRRRVLVAGGAGFIGSHLAERMLAEGYGVLAVDNLITGRRKNIAGLLRRPGFSFTKADVTTMKTPAGPLDGILHLASPASPVDFRRYALEILRANALGTIRLLEIARRKGAGFLLASTSEVYGDPTCHPQDEGYHGNVNPVGVRSAYDESKRFAEAAAVAHARRYGTRVHLARIFNTYGPRMRANDGRVVPNFAMCALRGKALDLYGGGRQTRSFCYVDDMVDGLVRLYRSRVQGPVNIGNPVETNIRSLAELCIRVVGRGRVRETDNPYPDDPRRRCPDIRLARRRLGWEPRVSLEEGLRRTVEYFRRETLGGRNKA